ncbi:MAG: RNA-binding domain-containing protein [Caldivirga sp.]|jgi:hypothetical protein
MCLVDRIDAETHAHATEDYDKVMSTLINLLGPGVAKLVEVSSLRGHYNNPIKVFRVVLRLKGCGNDDIVRGIAARLSDEDKRLIKLSLESRVSGNKLYLRFDKQRLYLNELTLSGGDDVVRVVIHLNPVRLRGSSMMSILKEVGLITG